MFGLPKRQLSYLLLCVMLLFCKTAAFLNHRPTSQPRRRSAGVGLIPRPNRPSGTQLQVLLAPQIAFAAACTWAVFSYVANNIDEIKAKQAVAVNQTMTKQSADLKAVQEKQKADIARIQEEQRLNILKAQKRVDDSRK